MSTATPTRMSFETLDVQPGFESSFRDNYNIRPFVFQHKLSSHPLLQLPYLTGVAELIAKQDPARLYYNVGHLGVARGWDYTAERPFSAQEALERIETADAWMILKGAQIVPEYAQLMDRLLAEIHEVSGKDLERTTTTRNISIIITSPNRITPYHMDADANYLLQFRGSKTIYVFDGTDRAVVTVGELERFYLGDVNATVYKEASQKNAYQFELRPGTGVHVPVTFPHWVQNGNNVSISASINFHLVDRTVPDVHRINHYLRKIGLNPKPPGKSAARDGAKRLAVKALKTVARRGSH